MEVAVLVLFCIVVYLVKSHNGLNVSNNNAGFTFNLFNITKNYKNVMKMKSKKRSKKA